MIEVLEAGLLERDAAARVVLLAAVAGEHVLLLGPPGTAKSELARRLQKIIETPVEGSGATVCFERLLTRFSTPEELFGPLSLKALENDRYERLVEGYLPTAQVAFLDEVFKANSAILNALLTLLNERVFDNGTQRLPVPLVTVVGASNETPEDEALQAFHDRFLLRVPVQPVGDASFGALVASDLGRLPLRSTAADESCLAERLNTASRQAVEDAAASVALTPDTLQALHALRTLLKAGNVVVSDRRWRALARLLRVAAAAEGRFTVEPCDLWLAAYVTAPNPQTLDQVVRWWQQDVLRIGPADAPGWRHSAQAFEKQLEVETQAPAEDGAESAGKMALARSLGGAEGTGGNREMLRLYSERVEARLRRRWSPCTFVPGWPRFETYGNRCRPRIRRPRPSGRSFRAGSWDGCGCHRPGPTTPWRPWASGWPCWKRWCKGCKPPSRVSQPCRSTKRWPTCRRPLPSPADGCRPKPTARSTGA